MKSITVKKPNIKKSSSVLSQTNNKKFHNNVVKSNTDLGSLRYHIADQTIRRTFRGKMNQLA